jgi:hypothetical protein
MKYRYVGEVVGELANGRPLAHGDIIDLSSKEAEEPHNQDMIDNGKLLAVQTGKKSGKESES